MLAGAAFAHNFSLASSAAGPTTNGKIAVLIGFVMLLGISWYNSDLKKKAERNKMAKKLLLTGRFWLKFVSTIAQPEGTWKDS